MLRVSLLARHQLHQRQQVDRIERVRDDQAAGIRQFRLQLGRHDARGGGGDDCRCIRRLSLSINTALDVEPLRHAFDDQTDIRDRLGDGLAESHCALRRAGALGEFFISPVGPGQHFVHLALSFGVRVIDRDIDPVFDQTRSPAAADYAAADQGGL